MEFFKQEDMDFFVSMHGNEYRKENQTHPQAGARIRRTIFEKVSHWGVRVAQQMDLNVETSNRWLKNYRAEFSEYAWCRIYPSEEDRQVFFNVGANAKSQTLVIKMDCKFSGTNKLDDEKVKIFRRYIATKFYNGQNLRWHQINMDTFDNYADLVKFSVQFIQENMDRFQEIHNRLNDENLEDEIILSRLESVQVENMELLKVDYIPEIEQEPSMLRESSVQYGDEFAEMNNFEEPPIDYISRNIENKKIGDYGEQLVMLYEQRKLDAWILSGQLPANKKAVKQPDRAGYDILSYTEDGEEIHIEVKTTVGHKNTPFYMSHNENLTMRKDLNWVLYRIHDIEPDRAKADFFVWNKKEVLLYVEFLTKSFYCRLKTEDRQHVQKLN